MLLFYTWLCFLLLLPCRTDTQTYNSSTQIAPKQRYAFLPSNNCTAQQDTVHCSEYNQCVTCTQVYQTNTNTSCNFGTNTQANCSYPDSLECSGNRYFIVNDVPCKYCYQLIRLAVSVQFQDQQPTSLTMGVDYECSNFTNNNTTSTCPSVATPPALFLSQCRVFSHVKCLGKRIFLVQRPCSHTGGYKWSTAFILSVLLGGLGIDRFYLLHWQTGLGKLLSFGGLGVWTLLDILLIGTGFLKPSDGSLYE